MARLPPKSKKSSRSAEAHLIERLVSEIGDALMARFPMERLEVELRKFILPNARYVSVSKLRLESRRCIGEPKRLPEVPGQILKLILVVFDGENRYIHEILENAQIGRLGNIGIGLQRIHRNQRTSQTGRPNSLDGQSGVIQDAQAIGSDDDHIQAQVSRKITKVVVSQNWNGDATGTFD